MKQSIAHRELALPQQVRHAEADKQQDHHGHGKDGKRHGASVSTYSLRDIAHRLISCRLPNPPDGSAADINICSSATQGCSCMAVVSKVWFVQLPNMPSGR